MKVRIYTDLHLFSPMVSKDKITKVSESYFIGDIVDLANCKKKLLKQAMYVYHKLRSQSLGWIDGNHERMFHRNYTLRITAGVIAVHGDFESWGATKAILYRTKKHGAGWFKRNLWVRALKNFEKLGKRKPSKKLIKNLIAKAILEDAHTIICGHAHPKETYDKTHQDIRIIVLKRGLNEVEFR